MLNPSHLNLSRHLHTHTHKHKHTPNQNIEHAAKIGNHELRNANVIFSSSMSLASSWSNNNNSNSNNVGPVRVPLMVMVDFLGSRSLATAKLPISPDTLVFGSDDAGENIRREDVLLPAFERPPYDLMRSISMSLNLKPHLVSDQQGTLVQIDSCADLEGIFTYWYSASLYFLSLCSFSLFNFHTRPIVCHES